MEAIEETGFAGRGPVRHLVGIERDEMKYYAIYRTPRKGNPTFLCHAYAVDTKRAIHVARHHAGARGPLAAHHIGATGYATALRRAGFTITEVREQWKDSENES